MFDTLSILYKRAFRKGYEVITFLEMGWNRILPV